MAARTLKLVIIRGMYGSRQVISEWKEWLYLHEFRNQTLFMYLDLSISAFMMPRNFFSFLEKTAALSGKGVDPLALEDEFNRLRTVSTDKTDPPNT